MMSRLIDFAFVVLYLLKFIFCGIIGISKFDFFNFSATESVNRNKNYVNKVNSRNSTFCNFLIKIYLESFVLVRYQFINYLESSTKVFLQLEHHIKLMVHQ